MYKTHVHASFTPQKMLHHHNHLVCYNAGLLHHPIYTLQDIPENDSFYLVCMQFQPSTLLLHYNTRPMGRLDHGNLS